MDIILNTNDSQRNLQLKNLRLFESHGEADLHVYSRGFSVEQHFYFDHIKKFLSDLRTMHNEFKGEAILRAEYEDDYIKFVGDKLGHIVVEGEVYWHAEFPQNIHFSFQTDQTVLMPFICDLEKAVKK